MSLTEDVIYAFSDTPWEHLKIGCYIPYVAYESRERALEVANRYIRYVNFLMQPQMSSQLPRQTERTDDGLFLIKINDSCWYGMAKVVTVYHRLPIWLREYAPERSSLISKLRAASSDSRFDKKDPRRTRVKYWARWSDGTMIRLKPKGRGRSVDYFNGDRLPVGITVNELTSKIGFYSVTLNYRAKSLMCVELPLNEVSQCVSKFRDIPLKNLEVLYRKKFCS